MKPDPICLALVICEAVHLHPFTGNRTILGTFNYIHSDSFPHKHSMFSVYVALTDCYPPFDLTFRITDSDGSAIPANVRGVVTEGSDPLEIVEFQFGIQDVEFSVPGTYHCQLLTESGVIFERRLIVLDSSKI